jgi:glycolate oxidase FAD binding subunit
MMATRPTKIEEVQAAARDYARLLPRGGGTKPALSTPPDGVAAFDSPPLTQLDLAALSGVLEYEPGEFTFTALAGTRIAEVNALLDEHGQYLPFDPLLVERGATLGGTVAAGISGPGRYRYGGVRDFLLGVRFVDGEGRLVRGGAKVVKNAAGFDIPKLMVGSLGSLGALVELTFKVFPRPDAYATLRLESRSLPDALQAFYRVHTARLDVDALELEPLAGSGVALWVRLAGLAKALPPRLERLRGLLGGGEVMEGAEEAALWRRARELDWVPSNGTLIKVPLTPGRIIPLEDGLAGKQVLRRYSGGGQAAWLASPEPPAAFEGLLASRGLAGLVVFGPPGAARLGLRTGDTFARRVKGALDPMGRFGEM